jgi:hypothetical protein
VVNLVAFAQAAQNRDRVLDRRLVHHHRLEATLERGILLDVLPVFVDRGGANGVQLAAREHRLEHLRGVHRALGRARADDRVQLVDEQDDQALGLGNLLEDRLQPLFEFAAVLGAGDKGPHVERKNAFVLQAFWHVAANDPLREPFDNRRLADAGFADEDRVVLRPPRKDLNDATHFLVTADNRIELALPGQVREIPSIAGECLVGGFRILRGHTLIPADLC